MITAIAILAVSDLILICIIGYFLSVREAFFEDVCCPYCSQKNLPEQNDTRHKLIYSGKRIMICYNCGKSFKLESAKIED